MSTQEVEDMVEKFERLLAQMYFWNGFRALHKANRLQPVLKSENALLICCDFFHNLHDTALERYKILGMLANFGMCIGFLGLFIADRGAGKGFCAFMLFGSLIASACIATTANALRRKLLFQEAANNFLMFQRLSVANLIAFNTWDIPTAEDNVFLQCKKGHGAYHSCEPSCPSCDIIPTAITDMLSGPDATAK